MIIIKRRKISKTLGNFQSPSVISLMRLIETQSKATLVKWSTDYVEKHILPIYENAYPTDDCPRLALTNAVGWLEGKVRFSDAKQSNYDTHSAATEAEGNPAAQAAARACAHAALTIHVVAHCLGIVFYSTAALAYAKVGLEETPEVYDEFAVVECKLMEDALRRVAVENEVNPAKIDWKLWNFIIR